MPRRRWDDPWQQYPASTPLPVENGLKVASRRGAIAGSWWSKRFTDVLESYGLGTRMQRGRRYARSGQVMSLDVTPGHIAAVLYVYAELLDDDPWQLLLWRGRTRDDVLGSLRSSDSGAPGRSIAPWWPLVPTADDGRPHDDRSGIERAGSAPFATDDTALAEPPDPPHRVLLRLGPLEADVGGTPLTDLLAAVYGPITDPTMNRDP